MQKVTHNQQSGAISMVTVIFLALLLSIITVSFIRLSISEQRQAVDDDLTTRAFYAAESGIEDAKRAISEYKKGNIELTDLNKDNCTPATAGAEIELTGGYAELSRELDTAYTCQMISFDPPDFQAQMSAWESLTIPLKSNSSFENLKIEWHNSGDGNFNSNSNIGNRLKTLIDWNGAGAIHPAMLRARIFSIPRGNFTRQQIQSEVAFINPGSSADTPTIGSNFDARVINANCNPGEYACSITVRGLNDNSRYYFLRLMVIYRDTHIKVSVTDGVGNDVSLKDVQALIDVTGKAGDVYRRVEARVSLLDDTYQLPDFALWSNDEICKNFTITNNPAGFSYPTSVPSKCQWLP